MPSDAEKAKCKRKVRFDSELAAKSALKKINPGGRGKLPSRMYKCPVCFKWHLSSQPKR